MLVVTILILGLVMFPRSPAEKVNLQNEIRLKFIFKNSTRRVTGKRRYSFFSKFLFMSSKV